MVWNLGGTEPDDGQAPEARTRPARSIGGAVVKSWQMRPSKLMLAEMKTLFFIIVIIIFFF